MKRSKKAAELGLVQESNEKYHSHPYLSFSAFKTLIDESPAHFEHRHILGNKDEPTKAMKFGTLAHAAIVEPQRFLDNYTIQPEFDKRTKVGKEGFAEWEASLSPNMIVMTKDESEKILGMIKSVQKYEKAANLLRGGIPEHSAYVVDSEFGIGMRARPDYIREDGIVVDLKTTVNAKLEQFTNTIFRKLHLQVQAAFHLRVLKQAMKFQPKGYAWLAIESEAPYCCAVYTPNEWVLEDGENVLRKGIALYKKCIERNRWPFQEEVQNISIPNWKLWEEHGE